MSQITRRALLRSSALAPVALAVGCSQLSSAAIALPAIAADFTTVADAVTSILPALSSIAGITTGTIATITGWIGTIEKAAGAVASAASNSAAQPLVTTLMNGVSGVIAALSGVKLPSSVSTILADAQTLLPVITAAVGIISNIPLAADPAAVAAARSRLEMAAATTIRR